MISRRLADDLVLPAADGAFTAAETAGLPPTVRRYFDASIAEGTPLARAARLWMHGSIKLKGRWLGFRAGQIESPARGFVWAARVGTVIVGSDRYVAGRGQMRWRLLGVVPVAQAEGPDLSRSAAGRGMGEAIWVPTALLPRFGTRWAQRDEQTITCVSSIDGHTTTLELALNGAGLPTSVTFDRWGDPDGTGAWSTYRFGFRVDRHATFGGVTIPAAGAAGWHFGTDRWPNGEFFRLEVANYELLG